MALNAANGLDFTMSSNIFGHLAPTSRGTRSFYEQLRSRDEEDEEDLEQHAGLNIDEENLRHRLHDFDTEDLTAGDSRITVGSAGIRTRDRPVPLDSPTSRWKAPEDEIDNEVPASLLVESNTTEPPGGAMPHRDAHRGHQRYTHPSTGAPPMPHAGAQWETTMAHQPIHRNAADTFSLRTQPRSLTAGKVSGGPREKALWRWVNTTNLDSFMRDVYDYFEGGGLWCILCSNALWLL